MSKKIMKKLVAKQFTVTDEIAELQVKDQYEVGAKFTHFQDPKTGKFYQAKEGFTIIAGDGEDLSDRFEEIISGK